MPLPNTRFLTADDFGRLLIISESLLEFREVAAGRSVRPEAQKMPFRTRGF